MYALYVLKDSPDRDDNLNCQQNAPDVTNIRKGRVGEQLIISTDKVYLATATSTQDHLKYQLTPITYSCTVLSRLLS